MVEAVFDIKEDAEAIQTIEDKTYSLPLPGVPGSKARLEYPVGYTIHIKDVVDNEDATFSYEIEDDEEYDTYISDSDKLTKEEKDLWKAIKDAAKDKDKVK